MDGKQPAPGKLGDPRRLLHGVEDKPLTDPLPLPSPIDRQLPQQSTTDRIRRIPPQRRRRQSTPNDGADHQRIEANHLIVAHDDIGARVITDLTSKRATAKPSILRLLSAVKRLKI